MVGISPRERTNGMVEREAEKKGSYSKDLTQLVLTDFCYVYRFRQKKSGGRNCGIGCEVLPKLLVVLHQLTVANMLNNPKGYD